MLTWSILVLENTMQYPAEMVTIFGCAKGKSQEPGRPGSFTNRAGLKVVLRSRGRQH